MAGRTVECFFNRNSQTIVQRTVCTEESALTQWPHQDAGTCQKLRTQALPSCRIATWAGTRGYEPRNANRRKQPSNQVSPLTSTPSLWAQRGSPWVAVGHHGRPSTAVRSAKGSCSLPSDWSCTASQRLVGEDCVTTACAGSAATVRQSILRYHMALFQRLDF